MLVAELVAARKKFGETSILSGLDLAVREGESIAILGRSGSGKSTLLSMLGLLDSLDSGTQRFNGQSVAEMKTKQLDRTRGSEIGFIFQRFALFPYLSAIENVMTPLRHIRSLKEAQRRALADEALEQVGLAPARKRVPSQLSGGEQQRVAIARALVVNPTLVLADEPTGALDIDTGEAVVDLLTKRLQERRSALVVVTHDPNVAAKMSRTLHLIDGRLTSHFGETS